MSTSIIVSQGRVGDRTAGALEGARLTGTALSELLDVAPRVVGTPAPPQQDDWSVSLPAANGTLSALADELKRALDRAQLPILATNTCGASLATLPVVAQHFPDAVLLWIDAHADFNTPDTTESGYLGGMVLAAGCGLWQSGHGAGINPKQVALVGARDIDPAEQKLLAETGVTVFSPQQVSPENLEQFIDGRDIWIHVDWDVLEPGYIPAAYRIDEGLLPHQIAAVFKSLPKGSVKGVEFAEVEAQNGEVAERLSIELIIETFQHLKL